MLERYIHKQEDVKLLYSYVEKVGLTTSNVDGETVNEDYCRLIFTAIMQDFLAHKLSVHDLSSLCELMWQKCERYSSLLLGAAEINWDIRHAPQTAATEIQELIKEFGTEPSTPQPKSITVAQ